MIAISENLIRDTRSGSYDEAQNGPNMFDLLLTGSPLPEEEEKIIYAHSMQVSNMRDEFRADEVEEKAEKRGPGGKGKAKIVKFDSSAGSMPSTIQFIKEPVEEAKIVPVTSSLAAEVSALVCRLNERAEKKPSPRPGRALKLKIFISGEDQPIVVTIEGPCSVADLIEKVVFLAEQEDRDLDCDDADVYELRRLEDEDTGLPDMEGPPLDRSTDIRLLGANSFAMLAGDEVGDKVRALRASRGSAPRLPKSRSLSLEMNKPGMMKNENKCFVRIHCGEETHVLNGPPTMTLGELLPMIRRKRMMDEVLVSHKFQFFYINDETHEVNMDTKLNEAESDDFRLVSKMPTLNFPATIGEKAQPVVGFHLSEVHEDHERPFNKDTASAYSEYIVIKTNSRGRKQKRVLGVDGTTIYNKANKATVSRASRSIASVASCQMIPNKDMSFSICFTEGDKRKLVVREYQTETYAECRQIVSKINFLVEQLKREERGRDAPYL